METLLGFNEEDFRFFKNPQSNVNSTKWDEVKHFDSVQDAINYWETTDYLEMHQVTVIGNQIHVIPYEY